MSSIAPRSRAAQSWRPSSERASIRPYTAAIEIDETPLRKLVKPLLAEQDRSMRQMMSRGMQQNEALLANSKAFSDAMMGHCMRAMLERDRRVIGLAKKDGARALRALRALGALEPIDLKWRDGREAAAIEQFAAELDASRAMREYSLRSRVVRVETAQGYSKTRVRLQELSLPSVHHVISCEDVARLRGGQTLVIDPVPALLSDEALSVAHKDLMRLVQGSGAVVRSENPCNLGSCKEACDAAMPALLRSSHAAARRANLRGGIAHGLLGRCVCDEWYLQCRSRHAPCQLCSGKGYGASLAHVRAHPQVFSAASARRALRLAAPPCCAVDDAARLLSGRHGCALQAASRSLAQRGQQPARADLPCVRQRRVGRGPRRRAPQVAPRARIREHSDRRGTHSRSSGHLRIR